MNDALALKTCPKCHNAATELIDVDAGMRLVLQKAGITDLPGKVCPSCYGSLTGQVSQGVKLRLEQQAKEKNRHMVWKSRVNLIKHARQMMAQKAYSEAAVSYEKYIRVLEMSYDLQPGGLSPSVFGKTARSKEITVIATTYWDLLRIYDSSPHYRERMATASKKLAEFLPYSPIFPDVIKKAQAFASSAKNPDLIRDFLKRSKAKSGACFIATATFDYPAHPTVLTLRSFRDQVLLRSTAGRRLVTLYYRVSPPIAERIRRTPIAKPPLRVIFYLLTIFIAPLVRPSHNE